MPSQIICLGASIKSSTTICNRRLPEFAFEWLQTYLEPFRHLSPPIALERDSSTVYLTVNPVWPDKNTISVRCLQIPETIEWE
jgi:hypothetical protein